MTSLQTNGGALILKNDLMISLTGLSISGVGIETPECFHLSSMQALNFDSVESVTTKKTLETVWLQAFLF